MHDGTDLVSALNATLAEASEAVQRIAAEAREMAQARARWKIARASKMLKLRMDSKLPASMVKEIAEGDVQVASLEAEAIAAEGVYDATREQVMLRKKEADSLREAIQREWGMVQR